LAALHNKEAATDAIACVTTTKHTTHHHRLSKTTCATIRLCLGQEAAMAMRLYLDYIPMGDAKITISVYS